MAVSQEHVNEITARAAVALVADKAKFALMVHTLARHYVAKELGPVQAASQRAAEKEAKRRERMATQKRDAWLDAFRSLGCEVEAAIAMLRPHAVKGAEKNAAEQSQAIEREKWMMKIRQNIQGGKPTAPAAAADPDAALRAQAEKEWKSLKIKDASETKKQRFIATRVQVLKSQRP